ncbi:MAG TPA: HAD family hydrolase, partial [Deltaproteobacteria bacterium]|nr:HAD family hydrolase [Deltaproteobacteria bacterium]
MFAARAAVFDLDCTLVDTLDRFFEVFNELLKNYGKPSITWEKFYE